MYSYQVKELDGSYTIKNKDGITTHSRIRSKHDANGKVIESALNDNTGIVIIDCANDTRLISENYLLPEEKL